MNKSIHTSAISNQVFFFFFCVCVVKEPYKRTKKSNLTFRPLQIHSVCPSKYIRQCYRHVEQAYKNFSMF